MRRGQKTSAEQVVLKLRQIEVQTAQGKSLALACKEAEISEQSYYRWRREYAGQTAAPRWPPARASRARLAANGQSPQGCNSERPRPGSLRTFEPG